MAACFKHCLYLRLVVERRIIHDDEAVGSQLWDQHLLHPRPHGMVRAAALKQHRRKPFTPTLRHDEIDVFAIIPADFSVDLLPARRPSVGTIAVFGEAAFVEINHVGAAVFLYPCAQSAQIIYSAIVMTFRVPRRFFY